jgi:hypothetical protein
MEPLDRDEEILGIEDDFDLRQKEAEEVWLYVSQERIADADGRRSDDFEWSMRLLREAFNDREAKLRHERYSVIAKNLKVCTSRLPFMCQY